MEKRLMIWLGTLLVLAARLPADAPSTAPAEPSVLESLDVAEVWSGHPVGFSLLTRGEHQFVAYYAKDRQMTVATRTLGERRWRFERLPSRLGWDSHNYVTLAADETGHLHLSGNMHNVPLIYFRTNKPGDIRTFRAVPRMVGDLEDKVTYPRFFEGPGGALVFTHRHGSSGNGIQIYNVYDAAAQTWRRLLDRPLLDGEGQRGSYPGPLVRDPNGVYHLCWVWRDSGDCSTNHDVCYARSRDLVQWERSDGTPLRLPMTLGTAEIVDPVPARGGVINGNVHAGFDLRGRPVVSYHKFDENGHTQVYNARIENGRWIPRQASRWDYRWYFEGGGAIHAEITLGPVRADSDGRLTQSFDHPRAGRGRWMLDPETLAAVDTLPPVRQAPAGLERVESPAPGMRVRWQGDAGKSRERGVYYLLRWETLPPNRDRPRPGEPPAPSMLRVLKLQRPEPPQR